MKGEVQRFAGCSYMLGFMQMNRYGVVLALAVLLSLPTLGREGSTLWRMGEHGIAYYRIPALCTATNGDLIAVCDARVKNCGDLDEYQPINTTCRRSSDGGKTWTRPQYIWKWPWNDKDRWSGADPSLIVDRETGKIFLLLNVWDWNHKADVYQFVVQESSDNGVTWSRPRNITEDIKVPGWPIGQVRQNGAFIFISSGSGCQLKDGTLMHTLVRVDHGVALIGSSDHGKTWRAFGNPAQKGNECKFVELQDGTWMINSRWRSGGRIVHRSKDRGMTWNTTNDVSLLDPACNGQLMRYGKVLLFSNCKSNDDRKNLHVRASIDDGRSWGEGVCVCPDGCGYSDMTILPNGDIGVLYEGAESASIEYRTIPRKDVIAEFMHKLNKFMHKSNKE